MYLIFNLRIKGYFKYKMNFISSECINYKLNVINI